MKQSSQLAQYLAHISHSGVSESICAECLNDSTNRQIKCSCNRRSNQLSTRIYLQKMGTNIVITPFVCTNFSPECNGSWLRHKTTST